MRNMRENLIAWAMISSRKATENIIAAIVTGDKLLCAHIWLSTRWDTQNRGAPEAHITACRHLSIKSPHTPLGLTEKIHATFCSAYLPCTQSRSSAVMPLLFLTGGKYSRKLLKRLQEISKTRTKETTAPPSSSSLRPACTMGTFANEPHPHSGGPSPLGLFILATPIHSTSLPAVNSSTADPCSHPD